MASVFKDVPEWPKQTSQHQQASLGHNQPPLEESLMMEFQDDLDREGITARVAQLLESAGKMPTEIGDDTVAGKVGDLCKMATDVEKRINAVREKHNRPLLNAQRALKGKADGMYAPLSNAIAGIRTRLNRYMADQARKVAEERRIAEEEASKARLAAIEAAPAMAPQIEEQIATPVIEKPVARGELGSKVGTRTVWKHEIESVRQLPDRLLKHPNVIEALNKVVAAEIRGGARDIKGVRIWDEQEAVVR